jgi:hypothetical protein
MVIMAMEHASWGLVKNIVLGPTSGIFSLIWDEA